MIRSLIVQALLPVIGAGGALAYTGQLPALPTGDTPPAAAAPAPAAQPALGGFQVIATCDDPQDPTRAAQAPAQARKASTRTVTVQVPQAPQRASQGVAQGVPADVAQAQPDAEPAETTTAPPSSSPATPAAEQGGVNVNTASESELEKGVNGWGPVKAAAVVKYRNEHGPFASLADLDKVPGVSSARVAGQVHV